MTIINGCPVSQWVWYANVPHCSMAMSAEHIHVYRLKFATLHQSWWRLRMSEKFLSWTTPHPNKNKQTYTLKHIVCSSKYKFRITCIFFFAPLCKNRYLCFELVSQSVYQVMSPQYLLTPLLESCHHNEDLSIMNFLSNPWNLWAKSSVYMLFTRVLIILFHSQLKNSYY